MADVRAVLADRLKRGHLSSSSRSPTGSKGLTLTTQVTNVTAQRLYEACGWTQVDEFLHYSRYR